MRLFLLGVLMLSLVPVLGDDAPPSTTITTTTSVDPATVGAPEEMLGALKIRARLKLLEISISKEGHGSQGDWDAIDGAIDDYQKQFGVTPQTTHNLIQLRKLELMDARKETDLARYRALLARLLADPLAPVAEMAQKMAVLTTQPVDLKYTAVDGTAVDLAQLHGKVVLIDFWATWCGPCREEVPDVVAAYNKYHDQGFEIVGVSLDQDRDALLAFTKENGMVWPQYFDGKGWKNEVSTRFDIHSIPAMWLLDKKGMLVTMRGGQDLDGEVGKLLAAP